ncbi:MAG: hypothetical protein PV340_03375 [Wolbachia sp.]|nr:hypothetical protein [Wolbachia sp.]MDD9336468.1 hypothetical protein [Wolbachia sp.]
MIKEQKFYHKHILRDTEWTNDTNIVQDIVDPLVNQIQDTMPLSDDNII